MLLTGNLSAEEVLKSTGMVKVKVTHDDSLHIPDVIAGSFDGIWKLHLLGVNGAREKISERRTCFGQYTSYYRSRTVWKYPSPVQVRLVRIVLPLAYSIEVLTISTSSAQPVSNRIKPMCGCSIRTAIMIKSRASFSGFLLLALLPFAPRRSLCDIRSWHS